MRMERTLLVSICLWGTILLGHSLKPLQDKDTNLETSSEQHEIETAGSNPGLTLLDRHVSGAALPHGK